MTTYDALRGLNWSTLKHMATSALACRWAMDHADDRDTPAKLLGRAEHCATLEPAEYERRYVVRPAGMNFTTKAGKAWRDAVPEGVDILTAEQDDLCRGMAAAVRANDDARAIIEGTEHEVPLSWSAMGVPCKGRLDMLSRRVVADLKTCRDLARFERDSAEMLYHGQLAWYLDGAIAAGRADDDAEARIIAVQSTPPHDVAVLRLGGYVTSVGRELWRKLLSDWIVCDRMGSWPGRLPGVTELDLPRWADPGAQEEYL